VSARVEDARWDEFVFGSAALESGAAGRVPHRLPAWARAQVDDVLFSYAEACPAGVTIRFETSASSVDLTLATSTVAASGSTPARVEVIVRQSEKERIVPVPGSTVAFLGPDNRIVDVRAGHPVTVRLPTDGGGPVEVLLPHNARVELIALESAGDLVARPPQGLRWTHYGSSISQGMDAVSAARTWPASAARELGWALRDLSFAGNAQLDGFVARTIREAPADLITMKVGINLVNADSMRERAFRPALHAFLDTIRERQPSTPIVLVSAVSCPVHESAPGPVLTGADGRARTAARAVEDDSGALTLSRTREIIAEVVRMRADDRLARLDGRELFGPDDVHLLYDGLHPDQTGLDLIAERFVQRIPTLAPFAVQP
jgi:lysophospholipase L1-like esterase